MALFERDDVATLYGACKICTKGTRSHVLEKAKYEEYITEVVIDSSDEFANSQWEDTEEVVKMRKAKSAIVVCHTCWLKRRKEIQDILEKDYQKWSDNPTDHFSRIQILAEICHMYKFDQESKKMRYLISMLKESTTQ